MSPPTPETALEREVAIARVDSRKARNSAMSAHELARATDRDVRDLRSAVNAGFQAIEDKLDDVIGDVRLVHVELRKQGEPRGRLDTLTELEKHVDMTPAQKKHARRRIWTQRAWRLARRCGAGAAVGASSVFAAGIAWLVMHALHIPLPLELLR